ncbi:hypothetical protein BH11ACT8_BH11ACT8_34180 [soil metagenome]
MTDHEIEQYVDGMADRVPHVDAPLGAVLAQGRAASARRARRRGALVLAAVVVLVAGIAVGPRLLVSQGDAEVMLPGGPETSAAPPSASGTRLVGADGIAVAVPAEWTFARSLCGPPLRGNVSIVDDAEPPPALSCPPTLISPADDAPAGLVIHLHADAPTPGVHGCATACRREYALPGSDVVFEVVTDDEALAARVGASLRTLDDDVVAVPPWPLEGSRPTSTSYRYGPVSADSYREVLADAGLVGVLAADLAPGERPDIAVPSEGSVVEVGHEVVLGVLDDGSSSGVPDSGDPTAAAGPVVPGGTRLVGADGVAIAAPADWVLTDPPFCGHPEKPYVYVADPVAFQHGCPYREQSPAPASLEISTTDNVRFAVGDSGCDDVGCHQAWRLDGVTFSAYAPLPGAQEVLDALGASLQALPDGWTAVPAWPSVETQPSPDETAFGPIPRADYLDLVEAAGLVVFHRAPPALGPGPIRRTEPGYGAVVPDGSTVAVDETRP